MSNPATDSTHPYWAVTGRVFGDDEDCPWVSPIAMTITRAYEAFTADMIATDLECRSEADLRQAVGLDTSASLADHVYIVSTFRSTAPIEHA